MNAEELNAEELVEELVGLYRIPVTASIKQNLKQSAENWAKEKVQPPIFLVEAKVFGSGTPITDFSVKSFHSVQHKESAPICYCREYHSQNEMMSTSKKPVDTDLVTFLRQRREKKGEETDNINLFDGQSYQIAMLPTEK